MRVHNELSLKPVRLYRERNDERKINRWLKVFVQLQYLTAFDVMEMRTLSDTRADSVWASFDADDNLRNQMSVRSRS